MRVLLALLAAVSLTAQRAPAPVQRRSVVSVPFVGCESDGQVGPRDKPVGKPVAISMSIAADSALSYYKAAESSLGVLAPRDWYCFGTYGSSGEALFVSPEPLDRKQFFSGNLTLNGPAIELSTKYGDTSGRSAVAEIIARVFPAYRYFVANVNEMFENENFSFGPYPKDLLVYRNKRTVEYRTPAQTEGLGTYSLFTRGAAPIDGVAILTGETPDLVLLSMRLNPDLSKWTSTIVRHVEREAAKLHE